MILKIYKSLLKLMFDSLYLKLEHKKKRKKKRKREIGRGVWGGNLPFSGYGLLFHAVKTNHDGVGRPIVLSRYLF